MKNYKLKITNEEKREKLIDLAYESFCKNLEMFRKNFDIRETPKNKRSKF